MKTTNLSANVAPLGGYAAQLVQTIAPIVRRNGEDFAVVVHLEHREVVREVLSRLVVETAAARIDWALARKSLHPPQSWLDDEDDNPFEPEEEPAS